MQRIMIIGCGGTGKSTLAKRLGEKLGIPYYHLDQLYWKPGWVESKKEEWAPKVEEIANKEKWVIDGNYGSTMEIRLKRADTVIFLNRPWYVSLYRILVRTWKQHGKTRWSMTKDCPERFDLEFMHYVAVYNITRRPGILKRLNELDDTVSVYILKTDKEINAFVDKIG